MRKNLFYWFAFFAICAFCSELRLSAYAEPEVNPDRTVELNKDSDFAIDQPDYDPHFPSYRRLPSKMAFGLRAAIYGVPYTAALGSVYQLFAEYILPWQKLGSWSIGMHVGSFPIYAPGTGIPNRQYENGIAGALIRYQFRYSAQQLVVPTGAVEWEYYHIKSSPTNDQVNGNDFGISGGLMLNLSFIDSQSWFEAYKSIGLVRSYFTAEVRTCAIDNATFTLSGLYWLWGVRLEIE